MSVIGGIMAGVGAAGSLGGAAISANAAQNAASTQANAADYAANLQKQEADQALAFQKQQWTTQQQNQAPFLQAGQGAVGTLAGLLGTPGQGLLTPYGEQFQAPTNVTEQNDPGYQFRLQQGLGALQNSAAARGGLLSGNTAQAEQQFGQDYASNEYGNVYNRALQQYQQRYNIFEQNQANQYNRLAGLAGTGQVAVGQLGQEGQAAAGNVGNIMLGSGAQIGSDIQNAAAARASGYVGTANAYGGALGGISNNIGQLMMLQSLYGNQAGANLSGVDMSGAPAGTLAGADPSLFLPQ